MKKVDLEQVAKTALEYYLAMTKLEDVPRQGYVDWKVPAPRIQSVPEHVYAATHLATAIWSEFDIDVDINKVILLLTFHENEETIIGDIPLESELKKYKSEIGEIAVNSITENLKRKEYIRGFVKEFNEQKTKEAIFAKFIDKLECDLRSKIYDELYHVDVVNQEGNPNFMNKLVQELLGKGCNFSEMWMEFGRIVYKYPKELNEVSEYAQKNSLLTIRDNILNKGKQRVRAYLDRVKCGK